MRARRRHKDHAPAAPARQAWKVLQSPEAHVTVDVADQVQVPRIPAVVLENLHGLISGRRDSMRKCCPIGKSARLIHSQQIHRPATVEAVKVMAMTCSSLTEPRSHVRRGKLKPDASRLTPEQSEGKWR